jgi:hypothetical protein
VGRASRPEGALLTSDLHEPSERDLRELEAQISLHPGEVLEVPVVAEDIGGQLVSIASEGLYSDPRDALREFAQNGVDAGASQITVRFSGLNVAIIDDGSGMAFAELLRARRFGRSGKSALTSVGFRGIGIYSAFQICDRLSIVSQQAGGDKRWTMTFEFANMRRTLAEYAADHESTRTALGPLIQANTGISFEPIPEHERRSVGSTIALLENLNTDAYTELVEENSLREYLRRTLPVAFSDDFEHREAIERHLRDMVSDYRVVRVRLTNDDTSLDEMITRSFPSGLDQPQFLVADWPPEDPQRRAVIWACAKPRETLRDAAGIYFKKKGFTIGDGREIREKFSRRPAIYEWYVGEAYIVDDGVVPNAARNGFEKNAAYRALWLSLDDPMNELLNSAEAISKRRRAEEVFKSVDLVVQRLAGTITEQSPYEDALSARDELAQQHEKIVSQKIPTKDPSYNALRSERARLLQVIDDERLRIKWVLQNTPPTAPSGPGDQTSNGRRDAKEREDETQDTDGSRDGAPHAEETDRSRERTEQQPGDDGRAEGDRPAGEPQGRRGGPDAEPSEKQEPAPQSLLTALGEIALTGDTRTNLELVDATLRTVLDHDQYVAVLAAIRSSVPR